MEARSVVIPSKKDSKIALNVIPGHFATSHSHINYYIDLTNIKHKHDIAKLAGAALAANYIGNTPVDAIVCMEGTDMISAYLAEALTDAAGEGQGSAITIFSPEYNTSGQMIFRDNLQRMIWGKNILLVLATVTTGKTINRALECARYYGGETVAVGALFSAISEIHEVPISSLFTIDDIPDYQSFLNHECPSCRAQKKIDAIVNSYGYSKI